MRTVILDPAPRCDLLRFATCVVFYDSAPPARRPWAHVFRYRHALPPVPRAHILPPACAQTLTRARAMTVTQHAHVLKVEGVAHVHLAPDLVVQHRGVPEGEGEGEGGGQGRTVHERQSKEAGVAWWRGRPTGPQRSLRGVLRGEASASPRGPRREARGAVEFAGRGTHLRYTAMLFFAMLRTGQQGGGRSHAGWEGGAAALGGGWTGQGRRQRTRRNGVEGMGSPTMHEPAMHAARRTGYRSKWVCRGTWGWRSSTRPG